MFCILFIVLGWYLFLYSFIPLLFSIWRSNSWQNGGLRKILNLLDMFLSFVLIKCKNEQLLPMGSEILRNVMCRISIDVICNYNLICD